MKYEYVVVEDNTHKCYNVVYKHEGVEYNIIAQVYYEGEVARGDSDTNMYIYDDHFYAPNLDFTLPLVKDNVIEIKCELPYDDCEDCSYTDSFSSMDFEAIKHLETKCSNVYLCKSVDDLELVYKSLGEPIIVDVGYDVEIDKDFFESILLSAKNNVSSGVLGGVLIYYYSEYDDFSCSGDGFTHMIKIINF